MQEQKIHLFSEGNSYKLYEGSMLDMLDVIEPNSIDAIVTDPPYEIGFMGRNWDKSSIAFQIDTWKKCLTVLKPGGYLLAFGGSRTSHRIACAIEDAGFEIRDTIMWLYGSGFPKSMNIGLAIDKKNGVESLDTGIASPNARPNSTKDNTLMRHGMVGKDFNIKQAQNEWQGWGTALKPAYEPIIVARKPCEGSCVDNVMRYGVGGINIDECRVGVEERTYKGAGSSPQKIDNHEKGDTGIGMLDGRGKDLEFTVNGRFPSNVILTYDETDYDEVCGGMPDTKSAIRTPTGGIILDPKSGWNNNSMTDTTVRGFDDSGSAARYFYCAKASKRDRDEGLDAFETKQCTGGGGGIGDYLSDVNSCSGKFGSEKAPHKNTHPTVKPTALMSYLIRLVTPKGGTILDPFNGSGSTGKASMYENKDRNAGYKYIGIELTPEYLPIADARIRYAIGDNSPVEYHKTDSSMVTPKSVKSNGQLSLFDLH